MRSRPRFHIGVPISEIHDERLKMDKVTCLILDSLAGSIRITHLDPRNREARLNNLITILRNKVLAP